MNEIDFKTILANTEAYLKVLHYRIQTFQEAVKHYNIQKNGSNYDDSLFARVRVIELEEKIFNAINEVNAKNILVQEYRVSAAEQQARKEEETKQAMKDFPEMLSRVRVILESPRDLVPETLRSDLVVAKLKEIVKKYDTLVENDELDREERRLLYKALLLTPFAQIWESHA